MSIVNQSDMFSSVFQDQKGKQAKKQTTKQYEITPPSLLFINSPPKSSQNQVSGKMFSVIPTLPPIKRDPEVSFYNKTFVHELKKITTITIIIPCKTKKTILNVILENIYVFFAVFEESSRGVLPKIRTSLIKESFCSKMLERTDLKLPKKIFLSCATIKQMMNSFLTSMSHLHIVLRQS